jgi:hypothetical protein
VRRTGALVGVAALALLATGCGSRHADKTPETTTASLSTKQADNQNALDGEAATIATDFFNLRGELDTLDADVPDGAQALAGERLHVQTAHHDLQLTSSATRAQVCADAFTTQRAADIVQRDIETQHGNRDTFVGDAQSVLFAVGQLRADNNQFRHELAVIRDYVPAGAPTAATVTAALTSARAAVTHAQSTLAADLQTANQLLGQATGYANRAQAACTKRGQ